MADLVTLTIDGVKVSVPKGTLVVDAAKQIGNDIPVFCYHPKMKPVGMCRVCLVEVGRPTRDRATGQFVLDDNGQPKITFGPKLETSCTLPVEEGMVVIGRGHKTDEARDDILEFLLTSHPLDCPVCDKGGECPLQNLTVRHGSGQSRFLFDEKQKSEKHVPLGTEADALIYLDRERCIQCARCVRFQDEIADDHVLGFYERGRKIEIVTFSEPGFDSKWSGNTTDICPVGALTTADFRLGARPWEMTPAASICNHCAVGCNVTFSTRREAKSGGAHVIKRVLPRQNEHVNEIWLCDKGRFGHHFVASQARLTQPLIRKDGKLTEASWDEALALVAEKFKGAGSGLAALVGDRLSNEDLYAIRQVVHGLGGRVELNSAMGGGDLAQLLGPAQGTNFSALGNPHAGAGGTAILVIASDLEEEAPLWWLRVKAAAQRGATLIVANGRATKLDRYAAHVIRYQYGEEIGTALGMLVAGSSEAADALAKAENALIVYGREGLDLAGSSALAQACANVLIATGHYGKANNGLLAVCPRANTMGAWALGIQPSGALLAEASAAWIVAADPLGDGTLSALPKFSVVQELFLTKTAEAADVVLPASAWAEREGTYTNGERRVQRFYPAVTPRGKPDYQMAAEIGARVNVTLPKFASLLFIEIAKTVPAYAGLSYAVLAKVEKQFPDVGGADLYYGGTAYENKEGLGAQLPSGAERGEPVAAGKVDAPSVKRLGLTLVPVTRLYDRGATFVPSTLMHPRVAEWQVEFNAADAGRMNIKDGDTVKVTVGAASALVKAHVNGRAPESVVLMPESFGPSVTAGAAKVAVSKA